MHTRDSHKCDRDFTIPLNEIFNIGATYSGISRKGSLASLTQNELALMTRSKGPWKALQASCTICKRMSFQVHHHGGLQGRHAAVHRLTNAERVMSILNTASWTVNLKNPPTSVAAHIWSPCTWASSTVLTFVLPCVQSFLFLVACLWDTNNAYLNLWHFVHCYVYGFKALSHSGISFPHLLLHKGSTILP